MSIVLELQRQAIDKDSDILSLLRKALLVAHKLELKEFEDWINSELYGYKNELIIPTYREIRCELKGLDPVNGWIPVMLPDLETEKVVLLQKIFDSIPSICSLLNSNNKYYTMKLNANKNAAISEFMRYETQYILLISPNLFENLVEQVKTEILKWSLLLEKKEIKGEGLSFSQEEKDRANADPQIINYTANFYSAVTGSQIQQGSSNSNQKK